MSKRGSRSAIFIENIVKHSHGETDEDYRERYIEHLRRWEASIKTIVRIQDQLRDEIGVIEKDLRDGDTGDLYVSLSKKLMSKSIRLKELGRAEAEIGLKIRSVKEKFGIATQARPSSQKSKTVKRIPEGAEKVKLTTRSLEDLVGEFNRNHHER